MSNLLQALCTDIHPPPARCQLNLLHLKATLYLKLQPCLPIRALHLDYHSRQHLFQSLLILSPPNCPLCWPIPILNHHKWLVWIAPSVHTLEKMIEGQHWTRAMEDWLTLEDILEYPEGKVCYIVDYSNVVQLILTQGAKKLSAVRVNLMPSITGSNVIVTLATCQMLPTLLMVSLHSGRSGTCTFNLIGASILPLKMLTFLGYHLARIQPRTP